MFCVIIVNTEPEEVLRTFEFVTSCSEATVSLKIPELTPKVIVLWRVVP